MNSQVRLTTVVVFVRAVVDTSTRPSHNNGLTRESLSNFLLFFFGQISQRNIERCRNKKKKRRKTKTSRIVNCRTHDRWGPESRNLQSRSSGKQKETWVSFVVENAHTTSNKVSFTDGSESETFLPVSSSSNTADSLAKNVCGHPVR